MSSSVISAARDDSRVSRASGFSSYTSFITRDETSFSFLLKLQHFVEQKLDKIEAGLGESDKKEDWKKCLHQLTELSTEEYEKVLPLLGPEREIKKDFSHLFTKYMRRGGILKSAVHIRLPKLAYVLQNFTCRFVDHWKVKNFEKWQRLSHEDKQSITVDVLRGTLLPLAKASIVDVIPSRSQVSSASRRSRASDLGLKDHLPEIHVDDSVSLVGDNHTEARDGSNASAAKSQLSVLVKENKLQKMGEEDSENDSKSSRSSKSSKSSKLSKKRSSSRREKRQQKKKLLRQLLEMIDEEDDTAVNSL